MADRLKRLVQILSSGVEALERVHVKDNGSSEYLSLDDPYTSSNPEQDGAVKDASRLIVAAAAQIIASVRSPIEVLQEYATGMYGTVTLAFANDHNVADVLKSSVVPVSD